jgi:hypothetical protein
MRANNIANPGCFEATQCWASKECGLYPRSHDAHNLGSPSLRFQDIGQRWGNPLASPELTWQAEGSGFRHQKTSREESGPVRGGAFVWGAPNRLPAEPLWSERGECMDRRSPQNFFATCNLMRTCELEPQRNLCREYGGPLLER